MLRVVIQGYGLPQADLITKQGNDRINESGKTFKSGSGMFAIVSFAVHWIKAEIHEYVLRNWRM